MVWNARQFAKPLSGMLSALLNLPNTFLKTMRVASSTITSLPKSRRTPAIMASVTRGPELRHGLCIGGEQSSARASKDCSHVLTPRGEHTHFRQAIRCPGHPARLRASQIEIDCDVGAQDFVFA